MKDDLETLVQRIFDLYNTAGPSERVYRAVSGHPVPRWEENKDGVVKHKWRVATSEAAIAGGNMVLGMLASGITDPTEIRKRLLANYGCGEWDHFKNDTAPNPHAQGNPKAIGYSGNC